MSDKIIMVDVDDTLYSFCNAARKVLATWTGPNEEQFRSAAYGIWTDWRSADDLCGGDFFDVIKVVHEDDSILSQEPFPDCAETLQELDAAGHRLKYVTSRDPKCFDATLQWLRDWEFPVDKRNLICSYDDKIEHTRECQFIIDDRPKTLVSFVYDFDWKYKHGSSNENKRRRGFGLHVTQNLSLTDVPDVYLAPNWALLRRYLAEKGGLLDG
jgi:hypothetical protein